MDWRRGSLALLLVLGFQAQAKTFQNSYVAFEVPDDWGCLQEGVAWTCNPLDQAAAKEAVIVLAAKVAGPEDTLAGFLAFLKQPKKIITKVGTAMPSEVMYAQSRELGGHNWVQSQHLGSEIQDYYTLYLATVKDQLAILVSFSAEKNRFQTYNPIFDKAIKTLRIVANNQLLFQKNKGSQSELIGINVPPGANTALSGDELLEGKKKLNVKKVSLALGFVLVVVGSVAYMLSTRRKKKRGGKKPAVKSK